MSSSFLICSFFASQLEVSRSQLSYIWTVITPLHFNLILATETFEISYIFFYYLEGVITPLHFNLVTFYSTFYIKHIKGCWNPCVCRCVREDISAFNLVQYLAAGTARINAEPSFTDLHYILISLKIVLKSDFFQTIILTFKNYIWKPLLSILLLHFILAASVILFLNV